MLGRGRGPGQLDELHDRLSAMPHLYEDVRARLIDWCGHAPDELVTWFSTINGKKPSTPLGPHRNLVGTFSAVSLEYAIDHSARRYRPSRPSEQMPWTDAPQIELMVTDPASLYAVPIAHPVHAPVVFHHADDDVHPVGEPLADSIEDLVRLWLHLFDHGLFYNPGDANAWGFNPDDPTGLDPRALQAACDAKRPRTRRGRTGAATIVTNAEHHQRGNDTPSIDTAQQRRRTPPAHTGLSPTHRSQCQPGTGTGVAQLPDPRPETVTHPAPPPPAELHPPDVSTPALKKPIRVATDGAEIR